MELLLELLASSAGVSLIQELEKLKAVAEREVQTSARNQPIDEVRLRAGRVEGIEKVVDHLNQLRKQNGT